jgi:tetratricopeptide (TPR) repeat protein
MALDLAPQSDLASRTIRAVYLASDSHAATVRRQHAPIRRIHLIPVHRHTKTPHLSARHPGIITTSIFLTVGLLVLGLTAVPCAAAAAQDIQACTSGGREVRIPACTRLLASHSLDKTNLAAVLYNRGNAYREISQSDAAIADYTAAITLKPDLVQAYNNRGSVYRSAGRTAEAIEDFSKALSLRPDDEGALINRAIVYADAGQYIRAINDFGAAIRLDPANAAAYSGRCWARAFSGFELSEAISDCNQVLKGEPGSASALASLGLIELRTGDYDVAISDYDQSLRANPQNAAALYGRGIAKLRLGDSDASVDLTAARTIDPRVEMEFAAHDLRP